MQSLATGNINYHVMGNPLGQGMAQHFPSIFKPISSTDETIDQTRRGLSLWMGAQASQCHDSIGKSLQEIQQFGSVNPGLIYNDPLVSTSSTPPSDYQLNWVFGNKVSSSSDMDSGSGRGVSNGDDLTSTSLPLNNVKENNGPQLVSVPSLFSAQHNPHQIPSANMSATAFLQKAAQIGVTSNDNITFPGSIGTKYNNNIQIQDGNKYSGLYASNTVPLITTLGCDLENPANDISTLNQLQMYPASKRRHILINEDSSSGGQTRDFLGVGGVQAICHPSSINGKFQEFEYFS